MPAPLPPHAGQPVASWGEALDWATTAVIMLHGRGASARSILELAPVLASPGVAFLAPGAAGGTWYPMSFMAPTAQNEPGITSGISVVHGLIDEVMAQGIPAERIGLLQTGQLDFVRQQGPLLVERHGLVVEVLHPRPAVGGLARGIGHGVDVVETEGLRGADLPLRQHAVIGAEVEIPRPRLARRQHHGDGHQRQPVHGPAGEMGEDAFASVHDDLQ